MRQTSRRWLRWLSGVAILMIGVVALPQAATADTTGSGVTATRSAEGDGLLPPGHWTDAQRAYLLDLIDRTEAALPAFADPAYLETLGFHDFGIDAPGGYAHYINPSWFDDGHILDPAYPESLLFRRTYGPGMTQSFELMAAMFFAPTGTTMETIPAGVAWVPGWHVHPDLCGTDDWRFAGLANNDGTCSQGHSLTGPPMTHVWIVDNACGHRFGMVDIGGLMCDMHMHEPDMPMPMPDPMPMPTAASTMPMPTSTTIDPASARPVTIRPGAAPPAEPVSAQPRFTG